MMKIVGVLLMSAALAGCVETTAGGEVSRAATSYETRSIAVLSNEPHDLRLCDSSCNTIVAFDNVAWRQTGRGYEATVTVSSEVFYGRSKMTLMRADEQGWSDWGSAELSYLRRNDVTAADPACVGGLAWCATRGL